MTDQVQSAGSALEREAEAYQEHVNHMQQLIAAREDVNQQIEQAERERLLKVGRIQILEEQRDAENPPVRDPDPSDPNAVPESEPLPQPATPEPTAA